LGIVFRRTAVPRITLLAAALLFPAGAIAQSAPAPVAQSTLSAPIGQPPAPMANAAPSAPSSAPKPMHASATKPHAATHSEAAKTTHKPAQHVAAKSTHKPVHHLAAAKKPHVTHVAHAASHTKKPVTNKL
jgi:hypothetical protein